VNRRKDPILKFCLISSNSRERKHLHPLKRNVITAGIVDKKSLPFKPDEELNNFEGEEILRKYL
jgi:hypothetical protein